MKGLQKLAGIAATFQGLIYIAAFVYFGAFWSYPVDGSPVEKNDLHGRKSTSIFNDLFSNVRGVWRFSGHTRYWYV